MVWCTGTWAKKIGILLSSESLCSDCSTCFFSAAIRASWFFWTTNVISYCNHLKFSTFNSLSLDSHLLSFALLHASRGSTAPARTHVEHAFVPMLKFPGCVSGIHEVMLLTLLPCDALQPSNRVWCDWTFQTVQRNKRYPPTLRTGQNNGSAAQVLVRIANSVSSRLYWFWWKTVV